VLPDRYALGEVRMRRGVADLVSPPNGPSFVGSPGCVDFAERSPNVVVRVGGSTRSDRHIAFSIDGGRHWFRATEPLGISLGGTVAAAADGSRFVWAPGDPDEPTVSSVGFGTLWMRCAGLPANAAVRSDRVNPGRFYGFKDGTFYASLDGGASFCPSLARGLPGGGTFKAAPGREGDIWLAGGDHGLWHSTDAGASFTRMSTVERADDIGFGPAAPRRGYRAVYVVAHIGGVRGCFRSDDRAASWVRVGNGHGVDGHPWPGENP
jgi:hypothetical protein